MDNKLKETTDNSQSLEEIIFFEIISDRFR